MYIHLDMIQMFFKCMCCVVCVWVRKSEKVVLFHFFFLFFISAFDLCKKYALNRKTHNNNSLQCMCIESAYECVCVCEGCRGYPTNPHNQTTVLHAWLANFLFAVLLLSSPPSTQKSLVKFETNSTATQKGRQPAINNSDLH